MSATRMMAILDSASQRWGKPDEFIKDLAPTGIDEVDSAIGGIRLFSGGIIGVQGYEGSRKTSLVLNIIDSELRSSRVPQNYWVLYDTLESGMTIERIGEVMVSILATKILVRWHWFKSKTDDMTELFSNKLPPIPQMELISEVGFDENDQRKRETIIRPEFLRGGRWTERQLKAINMARSIVGGYRMFVAGISENKDDDIAKQLTTRTWDLGESLERWCKMSEEWGVRQIVVDNVPQYIFRDTDNPYQKAVRVVEAALTWQRKYKGTFWIINQVPISQRGNNPMELPSQFGGARILEEAQLAWHMHYNPRQNPWYAKIAIKKSRVGFHPDLALPFEPNSGAIIGETKPASSVGL